MANIMTKTMTAANFACAATLALSTASCVSTAFAGEGGGLGGLIPSGITVTIGVSGVYEPKYEGAKSSEFNARPIIKFGSTSGGDADGPIGSVDARGFDDIGFGLIKKGPFEMGPALGYRQERQESDGAKLRGLGDVDGGFLVGGYAKYSFGSAYYLRASYLTQVTGDDTGGLFRFVGGAEYPITNQVKINWFTGLEAGDSNFNQTYFGVTAAQAARSGLAVTTIGGGAKSFHLGVGTEIEVLPTWILSGSGEYVHYLGKVANSPIVEEQDQFIAKVGLAKRFTFGN
jgi:MipA family protein